jgi:hypothetical protein
MIAPGEHEPLTQEDNCEGCDGTGIRAPATPSCLLPARYRSWVVVERCDYCEQFPDDLTAARTLFAETKWIQCATGGRHAVGRGSRGVISRVHARAELLRTRPLDKPEVPLGVRRALLQLHR